MGGGGGSAYDLRTDECLLDCGAFWGDSAYSFINYTNRKFEKIYLFEPEQANFDILQSYISLLDTEDRNKLEFYRHYIGNPGEPTIDEMFHEKGKKVTIVKMDIEGSELGALKGAEKLIKEQRPVLAVCVYHKWNDFIEIPEYIKSVVPDYELFIRKYHSNKSLQAYLKDEMVLYAVPPERLTHRGIGV